MQIGTCEDLEVKHAHLDEGRHGVIVGCPLHRQTGAGSNTMTPSTRMSSNGGPFSRPVRPSDQRSRPPSSLPLHRGAARRPLVDAAFCRKSERFRSPPFLHPAPAEAWASVAPRLRPGDQGCGRHLVVLGAGLRRSAYVNGGVIKSFRDRLALSMMPAMPCGLPRGFRPGA
jgi:hypothetical protein